MKLAADNWLGEIMGRPAFRVELAENDAAVGAAMAQHRAERVGAFYYSKVPCSRVAQVAELCAAGFRPVDVNLSFERGLEPLPSRIASVDVAVRSCTTADAAGALDVAGSAYRYSRFHLDPEVPDEVAHRIKREWAHNYIKGIRGDRLFVAVVGDQVAGFLAALKGDAGATIDLVGVATSHQRRGIGAALVRAFVDYYRTTVPRLFVGTQAANVPSVRMYEQLGFTLTGSSYVLHLYT
jgi:ribosomal protein S18 acetylase RimI-like enzyme